MYMYSYFLKFNYKYNSIYILWILLCSYFMVIVYNYDIFLELLLYRF